MSRPLVFIHADESCLGSQFKDRERPGGCGALLEFHHSEHGWVRRDLWYSEPDTTNNRMAIMSAILALSSLRRPSRVVFVSDSSYLVNGMSQWIHGWVKKSWQRGQKEVPNAELWQRLIPIAARHEIEWQWVRGHNAHPQNEYANHLATFAAKDQDQSDGPEPSKFMDWYRVMLEQGKVKEIEPRDPTRLSFKPDAKPPIIA